MIFHCQECRWVGMGASAAFEHEAYRHDGSQSCWPQGSGGRHEFVRAAWEQRCQDDEDWPWGLACWAPFDGLSGTWLYRLSGVVHRAAYAAKAVLCIRLRRRGPQGRWPVLVAVTGTRDVPTMEGTDHCWTALTVGHGWRPWTWRYSITRESSL